MTDDLVDRIYEAAFAPENWLGVVEDLCRVSGSSSGGVVVFRPGMPGPDALPDFRFDDIVGALATEPLGEAIRLILADDPSQPLTRMTRWFAGRLGGYRGFVPATEVLSEEELEHDPAQLSLVAVGLRADAALLTPTSATEAVSLTLLRGAGDGSFDERVIGALNAFGPHLSRASLIAARLGLQWADRTVATLQAIGLPAAVARASGAVVATNGLLDGMRETFLPAAFGRLALADQAANALFAQALESVRAGRTDAVRSVPVAATEKSPAAIVHVLPLVRSAFDIFSGAEILVVATAVGPTKSAPSPGILTGLFDLTPAEARLASALGSGRSLDAAAAASGITVKSARTYLERIFRKTGTNQQSQLVALLTTIHPFPTH